MVWKTIVRLDKANLLVALSNLLSGYNKQKAIENGDL
jgi:hypothetical protein